MTLGLLLSDQNLSRVLLLPLLPLQEWTKEDRREKRIGNWRDFAKDPAAKKVRATNYKVTRGVEVKLTLSRNVVAERFVAGSRSQEETRADKPKHGVVQLESWKKKWK